MISKNNNSNNNKKVMLTMEDVAKKAGVSRATVSRVLSNYPHINQETKKRVLETIKELNFHPNVIAQSLVSRETKTIAFIVPDIANHFYSEVAKGIEDIATQNAYSLIFGSTHENIEREEDLLHIFCSRRVDGIIISTCGAKINNYPDIVDGHIPLVLVARKSKYILTDMVGDDNVQGARQVVEHLIDQGYKNIATICVPLNLSTGEERFQGFKDALRDRGIEYRPELVFEGDNTIETGYNLMGKIMSTKPKPEAIFVANNMSAVGVLKYCKDHDIQIPSDIAVTSFDSFGYLDNLIKPSLTANLVSLYELGQTTMELLLKRIKYRYAPNNPQEIRLKPILNICESSIRP
jgi:DNA-binding LacI/PurR family transcriptional regulator